MPDENKVDIYMYCGYSVNADVETWESEMLSLLPDNQREVNLIASVSAGAQMMEAIIARIAAHEGDMIALDYEQMSALMTNMAFTPLEDFVDIDAITAANPEINWEDYSAVDDEGNEHIYMLPLDGVEGLYELGIEPKGNCIAVFFYSKNMEQYPYMPKLYNG